MSATTIYDVKLRYLMEDRASGGTRGLSRGLMEASRSSGLLEGSLKRIGVAAAGVFGMAAAKKSLVDFNADLQQSQITMAGLMQLNVGGSFADNMARATSLVARFQQEAKTSVGTTKDMVSMASMLTQPITAAGGGMEDIVQLTKGSVVGARAFGIAADVAARDVDQALRGQFHSVDQFTGKLLGAAGFAGEDGRARFNKMDASKRMETVRSALTQPAIKDMAKAQGDSFAGVLSTFQDNLQMFMGRVGLPLFKALTKEIAGWNAWIDKNATRVEEMAKTLSSGLSTAFGIVREVAGFMVEHAGTIMTLAKVWAGMKVAGMIGGAVRGGAGMVAGIGGLMGGAGAQVGGLGAAAGQAGSTLLTLFGPAGALAAAVGGFVAAVEADKAVDRSRQAPLVSAAREFNQGRGLVFSKTASDDLKERANEAIIERAKGLLTFAKDRGLLTDDLSGFKRDTGSGLVDALSQMGFRTDKESSEVANALLQLSRDSRDGLLDIRALLDGTETNKVPDFEPKKAMAEKAKVNVNIHRIEVQSDDPDRFVMGMVSAFSDAVRNPSSAVNAFREG